VSATGQACHLGNSARSSAQCAAPGAAIGSNLQAMLSLMSSLLVFLQCPHCLKGLPIPRHVVRLLQAEGGAASSSGDGAVAARAASDTGIMPSGPGVAEDLREVEDHFRRMKNLMLKLIDKYGNQPGDDAISDHIRRAHEDLQLKLVIASTRKAIVAEDELVTSSRSRSQRSDAPVEEEMHEALPVDEVPDVADVVDIVSGSSNDTEWYPEDHYTS